MSKCLKPKPKAQILGSGSDPLPDPKACRRQRYPYEPQVGMWLSLVERSFRVGEVGSSNLPIPTKTSSYSPPGSFPL